MTPETESTPERAQEESEQRRLIADCEGKRDGRSLDQADASEAHQGGWRTGPGFEEAANGTAQANAKQSQRQDDSKAENGPPEQRPEHAIPHQLHEKEGEPNDPGGEKDEARRRPDVRVGAPVGLPICGVDGRYLARPGQSTERRAGAEHGCTPQRHARAQCLEQNEIREQAANHRAERVQPVEHG